MTAIKLKKDIQKKIEKIDDISLLQEVDSIINLISSGKDDYNELSEEIKNAIEEGLAQLDNGKKLSYDEVEKRNARWFSA
mgnify:CR=1 FL=1